MTPEMSARFREVTDALVAHLKAPAAKAQLEIAQAEGVDQLLGQLLEAQQAMNETQQAMNATAGTLAEATAVMRDVEAAVAAPKRIELVRDEQGRAAGAVVHQGGQVPRRIELLRHDDGRLSGAE
jgi:predicted Zn-dependent protease